MEALDHTLFWLEVALVPISLGLLLAASGRARAKPPLWLAIVAVLAALAYLQSLWFLLLFALASPGVILLGRFADRRPRLQVLAVPLVLLTALTVAQPLGMRADGIYPAGHPPPWAGGERVDPTATHGEQVAGLSIVDFRLYRRDKFDPVAGLGECCPPTHDLMARSWVPPFLLTDADDIFGLCGDGPCWDPNDPSTRKTLALIDKDDTWYLVIKRDGLLYAWRLSAGLTSKLGLLYWLLAALGIGAVVARRRAYDRPDGEKGQS